jgi:hypothetical protein
MQNFSRHLEQFLSSRVYSRGGIWKVYDYPAYKNEKN